MLIFAVIVTLANCKVPVKEELLYRTQEKKKVTWLAGTSQYTDSGAYLTYTSDRYIEVILDTHDLRTRWVRKIIAGKKSYEFTRKGDSIAMWNKGRIHNYIRSEPIFDRHSLDYVLRNLDYDANFRKDIYVSTPELGIKKATLQVASQETVMTAVGKLFAWRVNLSARILLLFKYRIYFLVEVNHPHRLLVFEGVDHKMEIWTYRNCEEVGRPGNGESRGEGQ